MAPYTAKWTSLPPDKDVILAPQGYYGVWSVCSVTVAGRDLLASGGGDGTVWLWDPATGEPAGVLDGHSRIHSVCSVTVAGRDLLATAHDDGTVQVWDPATGEPAAAYKKRKSELTPRGPVPRAGPEPVIVLQGPDRAVRSVCPVTVADRNLLAAGSDDMTVRVWDPTTGEQVAVLDRRTHGYWGGGFNAVCPVSVDGRDLLDAGDDNGRVQVWDPATGEQVAVRDGHHQGGVRSVCPVTVAGRNLLASGSWDGTLLVWDPATGEVTPLGGHWGGIWSVCPVTVAGRSLLASGGEDSMVRVWDPATGASLDAIPTSGRVLAVHEVATLLAIGQDFGVQVGELNLSI
jgi:WD40 repeat protein